MVAPGIVVVAAVVETWPNRFRDCGYRLAKFEEIVAAAKDINVSDHDFCEYGGKLLCSYSWGDQRGHEYLALAEADCTEREFCESYFR